MSHHEQTVRHLETAGEAILDAWSGALRRVRHGQPLDGESEQLRREDMRRLLEALLAALRAGADDDPDHPGYGPLAAQLAATSDARAREGAAPVEVTAFVLGLRQGLEAVLGGDARTEVRRLGRVIDELALLTIERYMERREAVIRQQSLSLLELSTPVVKLWEGVVLLPLVGVVDTIRAQQVTERLLIAIAAHEAEVAVIDVTGVPVLDTGVAGHLIKTIAAARLLGAQVVVTGISPEGAQTLTRLGIHFENMTTRGSLRAGLEAALALIGKQVGERPAR